MQQLESEQQFENLKNEQTVFLFTADWCPDCKVIEPDLPQLEAKYTNYKFISVDRDKFIDICINYDIMGIPSFQYSVTGIKLAVILEKNENPKNK